MALIKVQDLALGYDGRILAEHLVFTVEAGDYLCIVGENGSGKTTLMRTLLGLLPPLKGKITYGDRFGPKEIGYLPQQSQAQRDFPASVKEIVLSGCRGERRRFFRSWEEKQKALRMMKQMGISHLADQSYRELSGGQQQRVLLARALCASGRLLLLDEPAGGLDPKAMADLYDVIRQRNAEGMAVVMITHDVRTALRDASHVLHVGRNSFFGTREEYYKSGRAEWFLSREGDARS